MRDKIRDEVIELFKKCSHVILNWATGVGKSACAITVANTQKPKKVLLVVAETPHKENWKKEFDKWDETQKLWEKVTVECYHSLGKYRDTEWDLIILDEGHHATSDIRLDHISTIKAKAVMVLTATLSQEDEDYLNTAFNTKFQRHVITLQQAIDLNLLPSPRIYVVTMQLNQTETTETITESWGNKDKRVALSVPFNRRFINRATNPSVDLSIRCTPAQKYYYLTEKLEYCRRRYLQLRQEFMKNKWLQLGSARKRFLAEMKTETLRNLLNKLQGKRYICFCGSISQATTLGEATSIHSKKKDSLKVIDKFNKGEINHLIAVNMLQEGQNLENIEVGVIAQLDGEERGFIQKFGRTLRADYPLQIILCFEGTRDMDYLENAIKDIDPDYIKQVQSIEEIPL